MTEIINFAFWAFVISVGLGILWWIAMIVIGLTTVVVNAIRKKQGKEDL